MDFFLTGNREKKKGGHEYLEIECCKCGYKKWQRTNRLNLNNPCNRLRHIRPDLISLLDDEEDDLQYTPMSHKVAKWKCPCCNTRFERSVATVVKRGFNCPICGIGVSFPNKMMYQILKQLNVQFYREHEFEWAKNKYYDFYIEEINAIIEMHGEQHYCDMKKNGKYEAFWGKTFEETLKNDCLKKDIALENGISHYIVIDSRISDYDYIYKNIERSELSNHYCLSNINKNLILNKIYSNDFVKEIIRLWENGLAIKSIAKEIGMFHTTVKKIIRNAASGGLTSYDPELEIEKNNKKIGLFNEKRITCLNDNIEHKSIISAAKYYDINTKPITENLKGKTQYCKSKTGERLVFEYV